MRCTHASGRNDPGLQLFVCLFAPRLGGPELRMQSQLVSTRPIKFAGCRQLGVTRTALIRTKSGAEARTGIKQLGVAGAVGGEHRLTCPVSIRPASRS